MRIKFAVTLYRCVGTVFFTLCLLQHFRLLDHRTIYRKQWVQLSKKVWVYSAYSGSDATVIVAAIDPPGQFDNVVCFHETPTLRHITFTTMRVMKDTDRGNLAVLTCPLVIPPGDHIGLRVVGSESWSRVHVEAGKPSESQEAYPPQVCYLKWTWFHEALDAASFDAYDALKWTNPLLGAGVDCFFRSVRQRLRDS